jgi:hypothetical protein
MGLKLTNKATSTLAANINNSQTSIAVTSSTGSRFPSLSGGDWFPIIVVAADGYEIMRATARSGDTLTVTRGQEGTTARSFDAGAIVDLRLTAAALAAMAEALTASSIAYAKIQNVSATDKLLGRASSGAGVIEEITCTAAGRALIDDANAAAQRTTLELATVAASGAYSDLTGKPTLGTAAALDVGTAASKVVQLDGSAKLPAVDGSALTHLSYANVDNRDFVRLSAQDLGGSAAAAISFTSAIDATYREYLFVFEQLVPATNNTQLLMEVSDDAGATWKTTNYKLAGLVAYSSASLSSFGGSSTAISLSLAEVSNSTNYGASGEVRLLSPASSNSRKRVLVNSGYHANSGLDAWVSGIAHWDGGNAPLTAVRFRYSSGNIADGKITMYGLR